MSHPLIISNGASILDPDIPLFQPIAGSTVLDVQASMLRNGQKPYHEELQYLGLLKELLDKADKDPTPREDRTGTGTYSVFGRQLRFNLSEGFPLLTTKRLFWRGIVGELRWILDGETNIESLVDQNIHIWDQWADKDGNLGPVYGKQWRAWEGREGHIDQIQNLIDEIKKNPGSRRLVVSAWNPADLPYMGLSPCHALFQFYVDDGYLSCQLYQRSADIFLGVPFNIASYALLTEMIAQECGLKAGELIISFGDVHLYANHTEQAREQVGRTPRPFPQLIITDNKGIDATYMDTQLLHYNPDQPIEAEVSV